MLTAFLAAGFVHGVAGFGAGIVAMAIVPTAFTMMDAVPIVTILWLLVTLALLAGGLRTHLGSPELRSIMIPLIVGAYAGVPLGIRLLTSVDQRILRLALGVCMLTFVAERTLHDLGWLGRPTQPPSGESGSDTESLTPLTPEGGDLLPASALHPAPARVPLARPPSRPLVAVLVGLASGMLSGALNEGGPPVVIFLALQGWHKDIVKAGLQAAGLLPIDDFVASGAAMVPRSALPSTPLLRRGGAACGCCGHRAGRAGLRPHRPAHFRASADRRHALRRCRVHP